MKKILAHLLAFCTTFMPVIAEENVQLRYLSNAPTYHRNDTRFELTQTLPGDEEIKLVAEQVLKGQLMIVAENGAAPVFHSPLDLKFSLKKFYVSLKVNEVEAIFDSDMEGETTEASGVLAILNRPILLHFGEDFVLQGNTEELVKLFKELPFLKEFNAEHLFADLIQHLFDLAGKDLVIGGKYQQTIKTEDKDRLLPINLEYTITAINQTEIAASIKGVADPRTISFAQNFVDIANHVGENNQSSYSLTVYGDVVGNIVWKRENALVYQMSIEYAYKGKVKIGDTEWPLNLRIVHTVESQG